ncbi:hypothetical protein U0070_003010 [Myodes glareolus]|uniref:Uncharacterized protein n=1 Tax=Myodes glareolus TaxID=447135 RepID=A0AAW0HSG0_MYOGA
MRVVKILEKHDPLKNTQAKYGSIPPDEASAVQNYVEHMLFLLIEEQAKDAAMGPILEFVVCENIMEKLFLWSLRREFTDETKLEQLKMYEMLVTQSYQPLLHHKPILKPLMMLLSSCSGTTTPAVEGKLVVLLNQLCSILAKDPSILELFFHTSEDQGAANFLIFSLLIPFIHREGTVLATGLSGLYSSLPTKLEEKGEEWHCLLKDDWLLLPPLVQFMNSLEFCNAVIQVLHGSSTTRGGLESAASSSLAGDPLKLKDMVAHPLIRSQLVSYIYNGFLVPVLAPALHKISKSPGHILREKCGSIVMSEGMFGMSSVEQGKELIQGGPSFEKLCCDSPVPDDEQSFDFVEVECGIHLPFKRKQAVHLVTVEEVMTTTAYLDLFLRSISEPALLEIFLRFILLHQHENVHILDTLTSRINTPFRLCVVSLALFRTLIGLHCEDVMLQLVLSNIAM